MIMDLIQTETEIVTILLNVSIL